MATLGVMKIASGEKEKSLITSQIAGENKMTTPATIADHLTGRWSFRKCMKLTMRIPFRVGVNRLSNGVLSVIRFSAFWRGRYKSRLSHEPGKWHLHFTPDADTSKTSI